MSEDEKVVTVTVGDRSWKIDHRFGRTLRETLTAEEWIKNNLDVMEEYMRFTGTSRAVRWRRSWRRWPWRQPTTCCRTSSA